MNTLPIVASDISSFPQMPLDIAVSGASTANDLIKSYQQISVWAVGGHSLGGTMAGQFTYDNPSNIRVLSLWQHTNLLELIFQKAVFMLQQFMVPMMGLLATRN